MAKTPTRSVIVTIMVLDANDGVVSDDETIDWFDQKARTALLKRMDKVILEGGYFEIKPT